MSMDCPPENELDWDAFAEWCAEQGRVEDDGAVADWLDDLAYTAACDRIEGDR